MKDKEIFARQIESIAIRSLLYEVSATPKPGLVDRNNSGAHRDMDIFTFIDSSSVLGETFYQCTLAGIEHRDGIEKLLEAIRPFGIRGEEKMLAITKDVNTHKGLLFSLGILSAAIGYIYQKNLGSISSIEEICGQVKSMTKGLVERELKNKNLSNPLTYGERLYLKHGITGIRGEVSSGFETLRTHGLPLLKELMEAEKGSLNERLVQVLLYLMAYTEDSNILGRHDLATLQRVQRKAKEVIALGGIFSKEGAKAIEELDKWCIDNWISPGGSADLLAVTIMLYFLEGLK